MAEGHPIEFAPLPTHSDFRNLTGQTFGMLTVLGYAGSQRSKANTLQLWWCLCTCGKTIKTVGARMLVGNTVSCGCKKKRLRHGHAGKANLTPEYRAWIAMRRRCYNTKTKDYPFYGGRGITVCDRWRDSFDNFLADVGSRPSDSHTLDRIDSDGPYEPSNCRWDTRLTQSRNRRNNVHITYQGETLCVGEWAKRVGLSTGTLFGRLKNGWTVEQALTIPLRVKRVS